jgi:hypothetical protein
MLLKLFAVRVVDDKQAVGFFWAPDLESLWWMIDEITDPGACECGLVDGPAAVTWAGQVPAMGVEREDVEDETSDREVLAREASFDYALGDVLYDSMKGWTRMPYTPEPGAGLPQILRKWGSWRRP